MVPAKLAAEYGLPRDWIVRGIVAALNIGIRQDPAVDRIAERVPFPKACRRVLKDDLYDRGRRAACQTKSNKPGTSGPL